MRHRPIVFAFAVALPCCGPAVNSRNPSPMAETDATTVRSETSAERTESKKGSETSNWSEVPPFESSSVGVGGGKRKSRIVVTSDPAKHGDNLHFRFLVNTVPISGVFVAPGGRSTTFTIPVGTVHFTVDECEWETQGFELAPDEEMPISCKLTKEGDCCEVAIPVEELPKKN